MEMSILWEVTGPPYLSVSLMGLALCVAAAPLLLLLLVVLSDLNAFNHLLFMEPVDEEDILRSRPEPSEALSTFAPNSSRCNKERNTVTTHIRQ